jgi:hypothetical protein
VDSDPGEDAASAEAARMSNAWSLKNTITGENVADTVRHYA